MQKFYVVTLHIPTGVKLLDGSTPPHFACTYQVFLRPEISLASPAPTETSFAAELMTCIIHVLLVLQCRSWYPTVVVFC
jgi:hypothetical protein